MQQTIELIRKRNRNLRADLDQATLNSAARDLAEHIFSLPEFAEATDIAAYSAVSGEIGLDPVIDQALSQGKNIYLPNLNQQALRFAPYSRQQKMRINRFKLPEPDVSDDELLAPQALDLVLAPLVAFDAMGNRIGMGGGFYDRSFAFRKDPAQPRPILIGVAHELQKVERLEAEPWDVQLDIIVTEQNIYR